MVTIAEAALEGMRLHAEAGYPLEICGLLVGRAEGERRIVEAAWPVPNVWEEDPQARARMLAALEAAGGAARAGEWAAASRERRYLIRPESILDAMKRARSLGLELVGVYHTHPEHPAVPSGFDRDAAWPEWSYVILSVRGGRVAEVRSWTLDAAGAFVEEPLA